jgi:hypothetical protein
MSLEKDIWRSAALETATQIRRVVKTRSPVAKRYWQDFRVGCLTSTIVHPGVISGTPGERLLIVSELSRR